MGDRSPAKGWEDELERWLAPFLGRLRRQAQRRWAPFYLKGLLLPGARKSVEPMAARVAPGDVQQLHHFVSASPWPTAPLEGELVKAAEFRGGLAERRLPWAVGVLPTQKVYPADVTLAPPERKATGRPPKHPVPSAASVGTAELFAALPRAAFRTISWRRGTKGPLRGSFAALRVRVADGALVARARHLPGEEAWLVCERRTGGKGKYYLANPPADVPLGRLAALIKARWACEQAHQQLKEELGLDHFEGRSWRGLHHHALLCQLACAFLQHLRLGEKRGRRLAQRRTAAAADAARGAPPRPGRARPRPPALPTLRPALHLPPPALNPAG